MGIKTGNPRGRPKGSTSKVILARRTLAAKAGDRAARRINNPFDGDSHEFLASVYKDPMQPLMKRIEAAKAAIQFEKPKLGSIIHGADADNPLFPTHIELRLVHSTG